MVYTEAAERNPVDGGDHSARKLPLFYIPLQTILAYVQRKSLFVKEGYQLL
jgi:hypothetical protein